MPIPAMTIPRMNLRSATSGALFSGATPGQVLVWDGAGWIASVVPAAALPAVAFDQNANAYSQVNGGASVQIATATITVRAGSLIKVTALAGVQGSVNTGRVFISVPALLTSIIGSQSFGTAVQDQFRTLNLSGISDPQPGGAVVAALMIDINGGAGARVDSAGKTLLLLEEIFQ